MLYPGNIFVIAAIGNFGLLFSYLMASLALLLFVARERRAPSILRCTLTSRSPPWWR
jgi:hypothetical protein